MAAREIEFAEIIFRISGSGPDRERTARTAAGRVAQVRLEINGAEMLKVQGVTWKLPITRLSFLPFYKPENQHVNI